MAEALNWRNSISLRMPETVDDEKRTIDIVAATDQPVLMPDWERMAMIPEVLIIEGARFANQVPLLDSHSRFSVKDQLGSVRSIKADGSALVGTAVFGKTQAASDAWTMVRDGHSTDLSVGYQIEKKRFIPEGETQKINGRDFRGPMNVVTKWKVREVSVTPIGADDQAKFRGLQQVPEWMLRSEHSGENEKANDESAHADNRQSQTTKEGISMNKELRDLCVSRGMAADLSDADAMKWLSENAPKWEQPKPAESRSVEAPAAKPEPSISEERIAALVADTLAKAEAARAEKRKIIKAHVEERCNKYQLGDDARKALSGCETIDEANEKLLELVASRSASNQVDTLFSGNTIEFRADSVDKFTDAAKTVLADRVLAPFSDKVRNQVFPESKRSKNADSIRNASLYELARQYVENVNRIDTRNLSRYDVAKIAWGFAEPHQIRSGANYHTTASFANVTLDAINKSMIAAYEEAPATWRICFRQGEPAQDFKQIHRIKMTESQNLDIWIEGTKPKEIGLGDEKVSYGVEARAAIASFTYHVLVNDDMDALTVIPQSLGNAAARTVNAYAWSLLTANPTMPDGQALFVSSLSGNRYSGINLITGSASPTVATVGSLRKLMRLQRGVNKKGPGGVDLAAGDAVLNIEARYLIGPAALENTILQLVNSTADPASSGNSGVFNTTRTLVPVIEPMLDSDSSTAFYTAAAYPTRTIEVSFLQGQERPVIESWMEPEDKSMKVSAVQCFGGAVIDHRGLAKHAGA